MLATAGCIAKISFWLYETSKFWGAILSIRFWKPVFLCLTFFLAACDEDLPPEVQGLKRISATQMVDYFKSGLSFCNKPNGKTGKCAAVQVLNSVNRDGMTVTMISGKAHSYKLLANVRLTIKDNMLCRDSAEHIGSMMSFRTSNDRAKIALGDSAVSDEKQKEVRARYQDLAEAGREYCWSYWWLDQPKDGLKSELVFVSYIDGVIQPFDAESTAAFFEKGSELLLRSN